MPADYTPRDGLGRPIDVERYYAELKRESSDDLRVERYEAPENPDLVAFRVIDSSGRVRGFIGFEYEAMDKELPTIALARVRRAAAINPRPDLKLVG